MTVEKGRIVWNMMEICELLKKYKRVAVVGVSPKADRDSHQIAQYLLDAGYTMIPIRPKQSELLGQKAYGALQEVADANISVDIVDFFRRSDQIPAHVEETIATGAKLVWMQSGIENMGAAQRFTDAGMDVVMNRCIKVDHQNCPSL